MAEQMEAATREAGVAGREAQGWFRVGGRGLVVELVSGLAVAEVERRLVLAMRAGEACNRALAFYLAEMEERRIYQALGFASAVHFARQRLGMGRARAYELLAVGRQLADLRQLDREFARGRLSWSKVRCVARVATEDTEQAWIARCREAARDEVEAMVAAVNRGDMPPKIGEGLPRSRFVMKVALDAVDREMLERAREKLEAETGRTVTDRDLLREALALILGSDADGTVKGRRRVDGSLFRVAVATEDLVPASRPRLESADSDARVSGRLRRRVLERDSHRCQACGSRRSLMIHHVVWRSQGGSTSIDNLCVVCARCHGLLHDRFLAVSGQPGRWVFRDRNGRRTDGRAVGPVPDVSLRFDSTAVD